MQRKEGACRSIGLLIAAVLLANLPDLDIIPGLLLGDPRLFHL
jgi:hypothetical protein